MDLNCNSPFNHKSLKILVHHVKNTRKGTEAQLRKPTAGLGHLSVNTGVGMGGHIFSLMLLGRRKNENDGKDGQAIIPEMEAE